MMTVTTNRGNIHNLSIESKTKTFDRKSILRFILMMTGICGIFTIGRLVAEKYWNISHNTLSIEIILMVGVLIIMHLGIPWLARTRK